MIPSNSTGRAEIQLDRTLVKGLQLLEALAKSPKPRGVTDLAAETGLQKSNVHHLLQTLAKLRYVGRDEETGRYVCTMRLWELGELVADRIDVRTIARPFLEKLAAETMETVHLSILDDLEVIYIDKVDSPHPIRAYSRIGGRAPAYCVATGKALLAYADASALKELSTRRLERFTKTTICNHKELAQELETVRVRGLAVNHAEWREGVNGIAAPVFDHHADAIAAVGVTCPAGRVTRSIMMKLGPKVIAVARGISELLGHHQ